MSYSIVTSGLQMMPAVAGSAPSAVGNFTMAREGDTTNGVSNGTQNKTTVTTSWTAATGTVDHNQIQRSADYAAFVDYATVGASVTSYTDTAATNIYNSDNIGEGGTNPGGQTTIYRYRVLACADAAGLVRGPAPSQTTMWMYKGASAAWSAAVAYRVGDVITSGGTQYFCWIANTNSAPPNGNWIALTGGNYCSGLGDLSFGGVFTYNDTGGSPVGGGTCILCTNTAGAGNVCGLQMPTGTPVCWNYGAEIGWANYFAFDFLPTTNSQQMDFAIFSRAPDPPGDVASRTNLSNFTNSGLYGPVPQVGVWATYVIPLSALFLTTPLVGITTLTGSVTAGVLNASSVPAGGIDPACWIAAPGSNTTPGASAGVWVSQNNPPQTGAGNYGVTMGPQGGVVPNFGSQALTNKRTNFYKTALKNTTGHSWRVNNIRFLENAS